MSQNNGFKILINVKIFQILNQNNYISCLIKKLDSNNNIINNLINLKNCIKIY